MSKVILSALGAASFLFASSAAFADSFVNGNFETGTVSGWTTSGGYRGNINNTALSPADATTADTYSSIIAKGALDPSVGAAIGNLTYGNSNYSYRVQDTTWGGYFSVLQQTVTNYTNPSIFFVWKAVLEGAHGLNDAAELLIHLTDLTDNKVLISRHYNAATSGGGVDTRFLSLDGYYYTPKWQVEELLIDSSLAGHDFSLSVLASDCEPTGHAGYVYIDEVSSAAPRPEVPEPAALSLITAGVLGFGLMRRRRQSA